MNVTPKFCENYESLLDNHFESILKNEHLSIPGFVVLAKRGDDAFDLGVEFHLSVLFACGSTTKSDQTIWQLTR